MNRTHLVEVDAPIDDEHLAGDGLGLAEGDGLQRDVIGARYLAEDGPLASPLGDGGREPQGHARPFHQARRNAVHRDLRGQGYREASREVNERGLARRIGDAAASWGEAAHRRDVDHAPGAAGLEVRRGGACKKEGAAGVRFQHPVPDVRGQRLQVRERDADVPGGVVDQDVEPAKALATSFTALSIDAGSR